MAHYSMIFREGYELGRWTWDELLVWIELRRLAGMQLPVRVERVT